MIIGVPKEIKNNEYRVGMTPGAVREAIAHGHSVLVETNAGTGIGCRDDAYIGVGAKITTTARDIFTNAQMIVKVKEPQPAECERLQKGQTLFTYLHLAADPLQTELLQKSGCTAIAYETITDRNGGLPLLAPMSEVAGRMSIQAGAHALQTTNGGSGVLLGGVPGTSAAKVLIIGGGVVGSNAARMALGLGASVTILDQSLSRLRYLDDVFGPSLQTRYATLEATEELALQSDLIIGAVLLRGAAAPKLISKYLLCNMKPGSVLVDVAIDQGGCFETSKPTTHADPTYVIDNIVHYCVANIPGAVPKTATDALNNATLPFILDLADKGWQQACRENYNLLQGLNVHEGHITCEAVARSLDMKFTPAEKFLPKR